MNTQDIIEKLQGAKPNFMEGTVRYCFEALPEENDCFTLDADMIVIYDDLRDYLESNLEIDEEDLDELYESTIRFIGYEGDDLMERFANDNWFDWEGFKEAIELSERMKVDDARDIIAAGLYLGVSLDNIEEAYLGKYESDADYAEQDAGQLGDLSNLPNYIRNNIDWEGVAMALTTEFMEENGYYFRNM